MLTKLTINNFKQFDHVEIELGNPVVFIGPNNSGKTTALQALTLWEIGLRRWLEKRGNGTVPSRSTGITLNRRDLLAVPVPTANLLWRDLQIRSQERKNGRQRTENIRLEIIVEGVIERHFWQCGLEFDFANQESLYCRPLRLEDGDNPQRMPVPEQVRFIRMAYLQPMSGLLANEPRLFNGAIQVRIGEGRTAEVVRNLCYQIWSGDKGEARWGKIVARIEYLFGVNLDEPRDIPERGEIEMTYRNQRGVTLDLSSSGRGLQQTLLLLVYLEANPGSILLLDEPDAHLEILRQRQIYQILSDIAAEQGNQIIAASHSEVILNEAADRDVVVAFVGKPHRIDDRGSQVLKALKEIGFDQYYQSETTGWVLYLEGSTDLAILRAFARNLNHQSLQALESPFVHYVFNQPVKARDHFYGLREAKPDLVGFALYDRLDRPLPPPSALSEHSWSSREIENYLCRRETLLNWAEKEGGRIEGDLFSIRWKEVMETTIDSLEDALRRLRKGSPWGSDIKASDEFLDPLFEDFYQRLGLPNLMRKTDYHTLAAYLPSDQIDPEVVKVLDSIAEIAKSAKSELTLG